MPEISTASLPDIIFMLLFFFMVVTVMRTEDMKLNVELPATEENEKVKSTAEKISIVVHHEVDAVMVNSTAIGLPELESYLGTIVADTHLSDRLSIPVYLRVDRATAMGRLYEVKLALRKTGLRKVQYIVDSKRK